jgi:hypothetical protein
MLLRLPQARGSQICGQFAAIRIPAAVEVLSIGSFAFCPRLCQVDFEPESKLARIEDVAFSPCPALASICIPASVEAIGEDVFAHANPAFSITFEPGSRVSDAARSQAEWRTPRGGF